MMLLITSLSSQTSCSFFGHPANLAPDEKLSLVELAAFEMCCERAVFQPMTIKQKQEMKQMCGGSWKLVLKYLLAGELCSRRGKAHAVAGPGHSLVVTNSGSVYSIGSNTSGQLGHGTTDQELHPRLIRSLQGIRIIHAAAGPQRTMPVSDTGLIYAMGKDYFRQNKSGADQGSILVTTPRLVDSLKDIFVVQAAIGKFFTAVLSREGRVYTFAWGDMNKLGHKSELLDLQPRRLLGPLDSIPVVQISGGSCYLLVLAYQPCGMSVYSVGCAYSGKLGHGTEVCEKQPKLIKEFERLNLEPMMVVAGFWHAVVVGKDGRVCTWGWNHRGCLGHSNDDSVWAPKVVEALSNVKAVHVAAGAYTTFVVSDDGDVYSFGCGASWNLGHDLTAEIADNQGNPDEGEDVDVPIPELVTSLKQTNERFVQISPTSSAYLNDHTLALTDSDMLYVFGASDNGQLGVGPIWSRSKGSFWKRDRGPCWYTDGGDGLEPTVRGLWSLSA